MFRQTPGVDLNDFPALGAPSNRSSSQASNRVAASYASTAGTALMQDPSLLGNNTDLPDYNMPMGLYPMQNNAQQNDLARRAVGPRGFSMDDFPALRSSSSASGAFAQAPAKQEVWSGYAARDATPTELNGEKQPQFGAKSNDLPSQWAQGRNDLTFTQQASGLRKATAMPLMEDKEDDASDPYGLLGLLGVIRMTDPDRSMLALGSDLTTLGLDLNTADSIYSTFISPWSDTQTPPGLNVEPGYYLPPCYRSAQVSPPAHQRMRTFSDEILFYVFYCMPRDVAQEAAAQELYNRNWRYHKELGLWLTKEVDENGKPVQSFRRISADNVDRGVYIFFDPTSWQKVKREWSLTWDAIEDRNPSPQQNMNLQ